MKKLGVTSLLFIFTAMVFGQITLDKKYDYSTSVVKLETQGYKYYLMDVPQEQCRIYNMDHSLFKTIKCDIPNGYYLADLKFVSENMFDTDSGIEIAYIYYKYISSGNGYYIYGSKIMNEEGSNILTIDNAQYLIVNKTNDSEYKLFAYCYDYSTFPEKVWTNIYSINETVATSINKMETPSDLYLKSFPNPASDLVKVVYELPEKVNTANLYLLDSSGKLISNYLIDNHTDYLELNVSRYSNGVYYYYIEYDNKRSESKKFVVR